MAVADQYSAKLRTAHDAIDLIRDGDHIVVSTGAGEPPALLGALSDRRREFHDVVVSSCLALRKLGYLDPETREHVRASSYFLGGATRPGTQDGSVDFVPNSFSQLPELIRDGFLPCDVAMAMASPMDEHGYFSISLGTDYTMQAIQKARVSILEVNPNVPYTFGDCHVHISEVTAVVEDESPLPETGLPQIGPVQEGIAAHVAELIPDGATLQIGIGAIPDAVVIQLMGKKDLGIHSEMFGDGILSLVEAGVVTNMKKSIDRGRMKATFALGSRKLYEWMDRNPEIEMHPVDHTNDPAVAGRHPNLHSINGTLQVDFLGQCVSESLGAKVFSGSGGQIDFVRAANRSPGGKSFICLPSTAKGDTISRIVPMLTQGSHITTGKNDVGYVVTEFGAALLRGKSASQRARALIGIAHPNFRDELTDAAKQMHLL